MTEFLSPETLRFFYHLNLQTISCISDLLLFLVCNIITIYQHFVYSHEQLFKECSVEGYHDPAYLTSNFLVLKAKDIFRLIQVLPAHPVADADGKELINATLDIEHKTLKCVITVRS